MLTSTALVASLGVTAAVPALAQVPPADRSCSGHRADGVTGFNPDGSAFGMMADRGDACRWTGGLQRRARPNYDQARQAAKQLLAFYRDLSGSFRGLGRPNSQGDGHAKGRDALGTPR